MSPVDLLVIGTLAGLLAYRLLLGRTHVGLLRAAVVGVLGALLGGLLASLPGSRPVAYLDAASLVIAVFGAALVITCARYARLFAVVLPSGERGDPRGERPRLVAMDGGGAGPPRGAARRAPGREPGS